MRAATTGAKDVQIIVDAAIRRTARQSNCRDDRYSRADGGRQDAISLSLYYSWTAIYAGARRDSRSLSPTLHTLPQASIAPFEKRL